MSQAFSLTKQSESPSASGKPNTHDVRLVNLSLVSEVQVIQESNDPPPPLTNLNIGKVRQIIDMFHPLLHVFKIDL